MPSISRRLGCLLTGLLIATTAAAAAAPSTSSTDDFQIVESVPVGTIYGQPGVPRTQAVWLQMIRAAQHHIDIAAFYIADKSGEALEPVLNALVQRARAGVNVRILLDSTFLKDDQTALDLLHGVPNLHIGVLPMKALTGGVLHAKYMIVDDHEVFVGSPNWDWRALDQIHEIGARIRSASFAHTFSAAFNFDWNLLDHPDLAYASIQAIAPADFDPLTTQHPLVIDDHDDNDHHRDDHSRHDPLTVFPAFSPPDLSPRWVTSEEDALVQMINAAQHHLDVQVMTLSALRSYGPKGWWPALDTAFRDAAARGVQVRIIVADWALHPPMQAYLQSLAVMPGITVKFSHLPPAAQGFIPYARVEHAKYAVADDNQIYIGTGNWEWSYFHTTVDASVFVHGHAPAQTLEQIFERDWSGPYVTQLMPGQTYQPPAVHG